MLSIHDQFPDFELLGAYNGQEITISSTSLKGLWSVIFFYPEDYSFICPTEVTGFDDYQEYFQSKDTHLLGISIDDVSTHLEWSKELGIDYPLGSDPDGNLAKKVGVLDPVDNRAHRATFVLDPAFRVQFAMVTSRNVGRSVEETVRVYHAIQSGKKCPAEYREKKE